MSCKAAGIRVATFNIRHGRGTDDVLDLHRTAGVIRETGADLIALQELDRGLGRSGGVDQPAVLSELTGLTIRYEPTLRRRSGDFGIAIAVRGPLDTRFQPLPRVTDERSHGVVVTRWRGISVAATHLSPRGSPRAAQATALAALASSLEEPVVVMGDLNQGRRGLRPLTRAGFTPTSRHTTLIAWLPRQLDHVLVGNGLVITRSWTIHSGASDHLPLVAELRFA
jgi:endonuclease/exonuclease/phosphatase family metal-dependent hydrolase